MLKITVHLFQGLYNINTNKAFNPKKVDRLEIKPNRKPEATKE
jgi:hypothetical protein